MTTRPLFTNNAATALAKAITPTDNVLQITAGTGSYFPTPTDGNYFYLTLIQINNPEVSEIVKCINKTGDYLTVERGQEGTAPQIFNISDNVELRITAASLNLFAIGGGGGGGGGATQTNEFTATQGQTVFSLSFTYVPNQQNLAVFVNGSKQIADVNYSEASDTTIAFFTGLNAGDLVEVIYNLPIAAGQVDASNIRYNEGGVGAVNQTVQTKLQQYLHVNDFGAKGDGTTDDTTAIQTAINEAAIQGGSTLHFAGNYKITSPLIIPYNVNFTMVGDAPVGSSGSTIFAGVAMDAMVKFGTGNNLSTYSFQMQRMVFDGKQLAKDILWFNAEPTAINITMNMMVFQNCAFVNATRAAAILGNPGTGAGSFDNGGNPTQSTLNGGLLNFYDCEFCCKYGIYQNATNWYGTTFDRCIFDGSRTSTTTLYEQIWSRYSSQLAINNCQISNGGKSFNSTSYAIRLSHGSVAINNFYTENYNAIYASPENNQFSTITIDGVIINSNADSGDGQYAIDIPTIGFSVSLNNVNVTTPITGGLRSRYVNVNSERVTANNVICGPKGKLITEARYNVVIQGMNVGQTMSIAPTPDMSEWHGDNFAPVGWSAYGSANLNEVNNANYHTIGGYLACQITSAATTSPVSGINNVIDYKAFGIKAMSAIVIADVGSNDPAKFGLMLGWNGNLNTTAIPLGIGTIYAFINPGVSSVSGQTFIPDTADFAVGTTITAFGVLQAYASSVLQAQILAYAVFPFSMSNTDDLGFLIDIAKTMRGGMTSYNTRSSNLAVQDGAARTLYSTAAPTNGTWAVGDIVYSVTPASGGNIGWVCTTAGSPGTWKTFGTIS